MLIHAFNRNALQALAQVPMERESIEVVADEVNEAGVSAVTNHKIEVVVRFVEFLDRIARVDLQRKV